MTSPGVAAGPELLRAWRKKRRLTQSACAKAIGIRQPTWCSYECGGTPRLEEAIKISRLTKGRVPVESWASASTEVDFGALAATGS